MRRLSSDVEAMVDSDLYLRMSLARCIPSSFTARLNGIFVQSHVGPVHCGSTVRAG